MPIRIGKLGAGGLGERAINGLKLIVPSSQSAQSWLAAGGYSFPNTSLLKQFIMGSEGVYGFLEYDRFFSDLGKMIFIGLPVVYRDLYLPSSDGLYIPIKTAALMHLLKNLQLDTALQVASGVITPEGMFALSVIWGAEVGLTSLGGNLYVSSTGKIDRISVPLGPFFLAHTHPTKSESALQVKDDISRCSQGRAEIVITQDLIIYYTKDFIHNQLLSVRAEKYIEQRLGLCIVRRTQLTLDLFNVLFTSLQPAIIAAALAERQEEARWAAVAAARNASAAVADGPDLFEELMAGNFTNAESDSDS